MLTRAPRRRRLPPGRAGLRRRLTPLAAPGSPGPYYTYCPLRPGTASDARGTREPGRSTLCESRVRAHDRLDDVHVAGAAADVALDCRPRLLLGRLRVLLEQRRRAHQHPRRAVAALERVMGRERLLQLAQLAVRRREPLD